MIIVIDALNRDRFEPLLDEMFRLRARVFGDRLGWEVTVEDGLEIDRFDALDPAYLVGLDDAGHVVSCARLLQTTGPHMLVDVFSSLLDGEPPLRSSRIWESTRFCVDTARLKATGGMSSISRATCEILIAISDYGMSAGISDIVTVIDPIMDRVLKRSNCAPHGYVGSQKPMGKVAALAALLDCSEERSQAVRAFSGIEGDVFLTDDEAFELFFSTRIEASWGNVITFPVLEPEDPSKVAASMEEIIGYCLGLIHEAQGPDERQKAFLVSKHLLTRIGLGRHIDVLVAATKAPLVLVRP